MCRLPPWPRRANIETVECVGVTSRLTRLDDSVAKRWPGLFRTGTRRRYQTMIVYQVIALVALFVAAGTGSWLVATVAVYPLAATLTELVRLMPRKGDADA